MDSKTVTFEITRTVADKDVPAAKEALEARLERVRERIPEAVVSEVATEPSEKGTGPSFRTSAVYVH